MEIEKEKVENKKSKEIQHANVIAVALDDKVKEKQKKKEKEIEQKNEKELTLIQKLGMLSKKIPYRKTLSQPGGEGVKDEYLFTREPF